MIPYLNYKLNLKKITPVIFFAQMFTIFFVSAQQKKLSINNLQLNTITTAVPFLMIAPDARSGSLVDAGAATSPDANAIHWNPAKLAFIEKTSGVSLTYTPWLRKLVPDISLSYLTGYYRYGKLQTFGLSLLYFSLGDIQFTGENGEDRGKGRPKEYAFTEVYSRKLSEAFSIGLDFKFVLSDLATGQMVGNKEVFSGKTLAGGFSMFYNKELTIGETKNTISSGLVISNIGNKITYTNSDDRDFIPGNIRFGLAYKYHIDEYNAFCLTADLNKLLVPTPPIRDANDSIIAGEDDKKELLDGIFGSFNDAPAGNEEELKEINYATGVEYWYEQLFAVRAGYFHEDVLKGARKYYTMGLGLRYNVFGLDFSYLVPASDQQTSNPLAETLRFTLSFDFEALDDGLVKPGEE